MLKSQEITERIEKWIKVQFPIAREKDIQLTDSLLNSGIIDSLGTLDVVLFLEDAFGFSVEEDEMVADHFESIESISNYVESKLAR